jgi:hypothetical protein
VSSPVEKPETVLPEMEDLKAEDDGPESYRPALEALNREQQEALEEFKRDGVESRENLLAWLLKLQYRTLGRLPDFWYFAVATRPGALAVVLTGDERGEYGEREATNVSLEEAAMFRRRLVARYLRPACRDAFRELRTSATEYLDDRRPDPERMAATAMRPALDESYQLQEPALESLLEGFDDMDGLEDWLHELDRATFGEIKAVEPDLDYKLLDNRTARRIMLRSEKRYVNARERLAGRYFLPATNISVRTLAARAGESDVTETDDSGGVDL